MKIRLLKSLEHKTNNRVSKMYRVGTILQLSDLDSINLINSKKAELYEGEYPPKDKMKMDLKQLNK